MGIQFANNASTTLNSAVSASSTTITVTTKANFPSVTAQGDYFYATLENSNGNEIIKVVGSPDQTTYSVERAQDGTTAQAFSSGDTFELRVTAVSLNSLDTNRARAFGDSTSSSLTTSFVEKIAFDSAPTSALTPRTLTLFLEHTIFIYSGSSLSTLSIEISAKAGTHNQINVGTATSVTIQSSMQTLYFSGDITDLIGNCGSLKNPNTAVAKAISEVRYDGSTDKTYVVVNAYGSSVVPSGSTATLWFSVDNFVTSGGWGVIDTIAPTLYTPGSGVVGVTSVNLHLGALDSSTEFRVRLKKSSSASTVSTNIRGAIT